MNKTPELNNISWLKHYRNRVIRCAVKIGWWMWAVWLPIYIFKVVGMDLTGIVHKSHPILGSIACIVCLGWLIIRIFKCDGLLETQYGHDLRLWLEKNYPLKWKTDHWFMAS